jgi:hypothetical protein
MFKLFTIFFLGFSIFLVQNSENWKEILIKLLDIVSISVNEYLLIFNNLFDKSFLGVLDIIKILVGDYFITFENCFNHSLDIFEVMINHYIDFLQSLTHVPDSWIYTLGAVSIVYILKH